MSATASRLGRIPVIAPFLFSLQVLRLEKFGERMEESDGAEDVYKHRHWREKREARRLLARFGVDAPDEDQDTIEIWLPFMARVIDAGEGSDLEKARSLMKDPDLRFTPGKKGQFAPPVGPTSWVRLEGDNAIPMP